MTTVCDTVFVVILVVACLLAGVCEAFQPMRALRVPRSSQLQMFAPAEAASLISSVDSGSLWLSAEEAAGSYSSLSLYFTLALYVLTLPGLYSLVTRSVKTKVRRSLHLSLFGITTAQLGLTSLTLNPTYRPCRRRTTSPAPQTQPLSPCGKQPRRLWLISRP